MKSKRCPNCNHDKCPIPGDSVECPTPVLFVESKNPDIISVDQSMGSTVVVGAGDRLEDAVQKIEDTDIGGLEGRVEDLEEDVVRIDNNVTSNSIAINGVANRVTTNEQKIANIDSRTTNNTSEINQIKVNMNNKVDKVPGKGLSTNDYTTQEKNKLAGIEMGAQVNTVFSVNGKVGNVVIQASDIDLSGYYTKEQVDAIVAQIRTSVYDGPYATVEDVPQPYNDNYLYLIGPESPYALYVPIDGVLTQIGSASVDLSNYYTKGEVDIIINDLQTALDGKATIMSIPQFSVPYRNIEGEGEPDSYITALETDATPGTLVMRNASGQAVVADPSEDNQAATKKYVDESRATSSRILTQSFDSFTTLGANRVSIPAEMQGYKYLIVKRNGVDQRIGVDNDYIIDDNMVIFAINFSVASVNEVITLIAIMDIDATGSHDVPAGGRAGQRLAKKSDADYDMEWIDPNGLATGFSVRPTGAQNFTSGARINFEEVIYNNGSGFSRENSTFTAPEDGFYHFDASVTLQGVTNDYIWLELRVNGNGINRFNRTQGSGNLQPVINTNVRLNKGDQVTVHAIVGSSPKNTESRFSFFSGYLIVKESIIQTARGNSDNFSLQETRTGRNWINGKSIYKKTINFGTLPNNGPKEVAHGVANLDEVISVTTHAKDVDQSGGADVAKWISIPYITSTGVTMGGFRVRTNDIVIVTNQDRSTITMLVTIEYTKTTDRETIILTEGEENA